LQTGINFGALDAGVFDKQLDGYGTFYPIIPTLLISVFVHWFGLAVTWLRLLSLLFGLGLLAASFSVAYQFSGSKRCGLIAVLLVATSHAFLISAHLIRYDIFVAALGYGAIAISIRGWRRKSSSLLFVAGLLIGLAFEIHMNAVLFLPLILIILLAEGGWRIVRSPQFGGLVLGGLFGLGLYTLVHVIQYPATFFAMAKGFTLTHLPPLFSPGLDQFWSSIDEMARYWIYLTSGRIVIIALVAGTLYRMRFENTKILFLSLIIGLIVFSLLIRNKMFYYAILVGPLLDIFLAVWIYEISRGDIQLSFWSKRIKALGISILIATCGVPLYLVFSSSPPEDLKSIGNRIKQTVPVKAYIMGPQTYWFELYEHRYLSWQQILIHAVLNPNSSIDTALNALRPDFLLIDDDMRQYILSKHVDRPRSSFERYTRIRGLSKEELDSFLNRHSDLVDSFTSTTYGRIQLYSMHWNTSK
jgi:4-amino-4-deoxy-L-arabinose transferase-like glycosyltransferase